MDGTILGGIVVALLTIVAGLISKIEPRSQRETADENKVLARALGTIESLTKQNRSLADELETCRALHHARARARSGGGISTRKRAPDAQGE